MNESTLTRAAFAVGAAALLVVGVQLFSRKRTNVIATTADIESMIAALDPVSRAAVVTRLTADAAESVKERFGR